MFLRSLSVGKSSQVSSVAFDLRSDQAVKIENAPV